MRESKDTAGSIDVSVEAATIGRERGAASVGGRSVHSSCRAVGAARVHLLAPGCLRGTAPASTLQKTSVLRVDSDLGVQHRVAAW